MSILSLLLGLDSRDNLEKAIAKMEILNCIRVRLHVSPYLSAINHTDTGTVNHSQMAIWCQPGGTPRSLPSPPLATLDTRAPIFYFSPFANAVNLTLHR